MIRKILLWVFGLVPAVLWVLYSILTTILVLLAVQSGPGLTVFYSVIGVLSIWSATTIILVILDKPAKHERYGLIAAIVLLANVVLGGLDGVEKAFELAWFFAALSLLVVSVYLLWATIRDSKKTVLK